MVEEVSLARLYVMRGMYLVNCLLVGSGVWYEFMHRQHASHSPCDSKTLR